MTDNRGEVVARYEPVLLDDLGRLYAGMQSSQLGGFVKYEDHQSLLLAAREECERLKQAIWDARAAMGFDNDGNPTPAALSHPSLAELCVRDAREFRRDYDQACAEADRAEAELAECRRDAERYRWLRSNRFDGPLVLSGKTHPEIDDELSGNDLDAAIDACVGGEESK